MVTTVYYLRNPNFSQNLFSRKCVLFPTDHRTSGFNKTHGLPDALSIVTLNGWATKQRKKTDYLECVSERVICLAADQIKNGEK